jgi:hypothetical protein
MSEAKLEDLWQRVEKRLGRPVPVEIRKLVSRELWIDPVLCGDSGAFEYLVGQARDLLAARESGLNDAGKKAASKRVGPPGYVAAPKLLTDEEDRRSQVLTNYMHRDATSHPLVRDFRKRVMGGRLCTPRQARSLLRNPALAYLQLEHFDDLPEPLSDIGGQIEHDTYEFHSFGQTRVAFRILSIRLTGCEPSRMHVVALPSQYERTSAGIPALRFQPDGEQRSSVRVAPGSPLHWLKNLASVLSRRYFWPEDRACWFVLTGTRVPVPAIDVSTHVSMQGGLTGGKLTLTIAPWTSFGSVARIYEDARHWFTGAKNRSIGVRNLDLLEFIEDTRAEDEAKTWPVLFGLWKAHLKSTRQRSWHQNYKKFANAHSRLLQALIRPTYPQGKSLRAVREEAAESRKLRSEILQARDWDTKEAILQRFAALGTEEPAPLDPRQRLSGTGPVARPKGSR